MSLAVSSPQPSPQPSAASRPITLAMRTALGFAHTGALYREAGGHWRCRAYPNEAVRDGTARALEERGFLLIQEYEGLHRVRRACMVITPAGRRAYGDGRLASASPPPVQAEAILREVEAALSVLTHESEMLGRQQKAANEAAIDARQKQAKSTQALDRIEARLAELARIRSNLDARRVELRCLVVEAAERMMEARS
jgi:hypothetical protein